MLSNHTISLVQKTIPLLANAGTDVTEQFYQRMFAAHPELLHIFNLSNQKSGRQQFALFSALAAYASHLENPEVLSEAISRINHKHTSLNIQPQHYPIVGTHLIGTLEDLFPEQFTPDIKAAWVEAYRYLADLFITQEEGLYRKSEQVMGGWRGKRRFKITRIEQPSSLVKSFYLTPCDGRPVPTYCVGQYLAIECSISGQTHKQIRQYSLSQSPKKDHFRISVKKEGLVSSHLHTLNVGDELEAYPPAGDFILQATHCPKVLISAGVGITPMMAMLEHTLERKSALSQQINTNEGLQNKSALYFLHASRNQEELSFQSQLNDIEQQHDDFHLHFWLESVPTETCKHYHAGLMNITSIKASLPIDSGEFYLCGPVAFMSAMKKQLLTLGVKESQLFYEVFGPHADL